VTPINGAGYLADRPRPTWFALLLVVAFVAALVVPMDRVLKRVSALSDENRSAASRPTPVWTLDGLLAYRKQFTSYFDDHFGSRGALLAIDHWARAAIFGVSPVPNVLLGKQGWLYFLGEDGKSMERWYRGSQPFSDAEIAALRTELLHRRDYLAKRGIPYVVVVVPEKYTIYPEFLPSWTTPLHARSSLDRIADELARHPQLNFVDLRGPLRAAKTADRLYYKTDSHWNYLGATVGYRTLMDRLRAILPDLPFVPPARPVYEAGVDFYSGDLARMVGMSGWIREDDVAPLGKIFMSADTRCAHKDTSRESPGSEVYVYRCAEPRRYRALMYRDSMAISLIPMLSENFSEIVYVASRTLDAAQVERLHPDIVIEELVERSLNAPAAYPVTTQ
jgi:alginate O-acetyltransferase complex protein AlgJ